MKKTTLFLLCLLLASVGIAQINAITETGDEVLLYEDGTWRYKVAEKMEKVEVPMNDKAFSRSEEATFLLKSKKAKVGIYLDAKKWNFVKGHQNSEAEYELNLRDGDLFGMIISEKIEIPINTLRSIAFENGKAVAPDLKVVHEEYRMVNGVKVLLMEMNGTIQGIKFSYFGYYYSDESGTVQIITYSSQSLMKEQKSLCEELLNGFVTIEE